MTSGPVAAVANFSARIAEAATRFPARPAIERLSDSGVETTTYAELMRLAHRFAGWFTSLGLARGDRVALLADNDARWIAAYLGALRIGLVAVPLDTAYKPAQVRTILDSSGARVLLTSSRYQDTARTAVRLGAAGTCTLALIAGAAEGSATPDPPLVDVAPSDAAVILYTSGTTADPKGVVLTHANLDAERLAAFGVIHANEHDAVLGVLPLFHALAQMANLLLPLAIGARVVFLETVSSSSLLEALQTRDITIFACVPQFFYLIHQRVMAEFAKRPWIVRAALKRIIAANAWLRDRAGWNPGRRVFARVHRTLGARMRVLITGGSRFDPAIGRDLYGMGFTLLNAYGLTETSGGATVTRPGDRFTTSVGQPLPGVEIQIAPREPGQDREISDGEILIRGPIVMREYFHRPDATAASIVDGWLRTGDLGRLDADGRLYITGRKKEIIVLSSGKNLYPEEIEAHYRTSAFIKEICVLGLTRLGEPAAERLHAVIVPDDAALRERGVVNIRELIRFELEGLSVSLPPHKRILTYDVWLEALPRTSTGKLKRPEIERRVREQAAAADAPDTPLTNDEQTWLAVPERAALAAIVAGRLDKPGVRPDANLELDLGLDSMERVELLTLLERRQGTRVAPETRATIFSVRQLIDAVIAAPRSTSADAPATGADTGDAMPWAAVLAAPPDPAVVAPLRKPKRIRAAFFFVVLRVARIVMRVWLRFRVRGTAHLPHDGPFLICPNHLAYMDGFFLAAALPYRLLRQVFFVGAAEYFETPAMKWWAEAVNIVPVDPDANLVTAMQAGATGLRLGKVLILFPEGERSIDGEVKRFKKGAAILASTLDVPIVPVALDGLFDLWPRGRAFQWRALLPWRAKGVTLEFGGPLTIARGMEESETARLRDAVIAMRGKIKSEERVSLRKERDRMLALVTGGSAGIGVELARELAKRKCDLILAARSRAALETVARDLAAAHGIATHVIVSDLSTPGAAERLARDAMAIGRLDVLVNNAGFGAFGSFADRPLDEQMSMVRVNIDALTELTWRVMPHLLESRGKILNVASTAAFQPGPLMAVYYATKAYVLSFSEAIAEELSDRGVTVTCLCPGPTKSGFQERAGVEESRLVKLGMMKADRVARAGVAGLFAGRRLVVPGLTNRLGAQLPRVSPRRATTKVVRWIQDKRPSTR